MKKPFKFMCVLFFYTGLFISFAKLVMPFALPDFMSGFLDGMSTIFLLIGIPYMVWCLRKKNNFLNFNG